MDAGSIFNLPLFSLQGFYLQFLLISCAPFCKFLNYRGLTTPCNTQELYSFPELLFPSDLLNPISSLLLRQLWLKLMFLTPLLWYLNHSFSFYPCSGILFYFFSSTMYVTWMCVFLSDSNSVGCCES